MKSPACTLSSHHGKKLASSYSQCFAHAASSIDQLVKGLDCGEEVGEREGKTRSESVCLTFLELTVEPELLCQRKVKSH